MQMKNNNNSEHSRATTADQRLAILFVDDEDKARKYFARVFSSSYEVICASSVEEAMDLLEAKSKALAVLITDQRMPAGKGIDLIKYARRNHPHIVRILTTAYADISEAIDSVNEGEVFRYIRKLWDLPELEKEVGNAINRFLQQQEERQLIYGKRETMYRVASNIAHELRTPLTGIAAAVDGMEPDLDTLLKVYERAQRSELVLPSIPDPRRRLLSGVMKAIRSQVARAHNIIDMLLVSAKPDDANELDMIYAAACVSEAVASYPMSDERREKIRITVEEDFIFYGVPLLAQHVLFNLLKNALYSIDSVDRPAGIHIKVYRSGNRGMIAIRDEGAGIKPEHLPYIFDDFFTTKLSSSNNGVGLPFCKSTLQKWSASIVCHSEPGSFTEFVMSFPIEHEGCIA